MEVVMTRHARRRCVVRRVPHGVARAVRDAILAMLPGRLPKDKSFMQGSIIKLMLGGIHKGFKAVCVLEPDRGRVIVVTVYSRKARQSA